MLSRTPALPYFDVSVNGVYLKAYSSSVQIIEATDSHPFALLNVEYIGAKTVQGIKGLRGSWNYIPEHTPIAITFGMKPNYLGQFLGYVSSYKLINTGTGTNTNNLNMTCVQYTIVGTSQIMQSTINYAWKNTSPSAIATAIAVRNGFRSIVHPYTSAIDYRLQNVSDFKFLAQLAKEIGFRFYVDNTDLYFINPKIILDRSNIRNVPQFWSYNRPNLWDSIRSFEPVVGTITPDGGIVADRAISGINTNTQQLFSTSTPTDVNNFSYGPTITKYYNDAPANTFYEGQQKVQASVNDNLYWVTADTELLGNYRVKPNILIELTGTAIPETESGFWLVKSVTHNLSMPAPTGNKNAAKYTMSAEIVRDQAYTATTFPVSQLAPAVQTVPSVLIGGVWRSSNVGAKVYAT